ncbi:MAG: hypothetical protein ACYDBB_03700 [Armatimonadota bacterium]
MKLHHSSRWLLVLAVAVFGVLAPSILRAQQVVAPANLCVNGDFETGITGWTGQLTDNNAEKRKGQQKDYPSWEKIDTDVKAAAPGAKAEKSAGALKVTLQDIPAKSMGHQTGVLCHLNMSVKAVDTDLQVTFSAKLLEPAEANLQVVRTWGGGGADPVNLTHEWKRYRVYIPMGFDAQDIMFSLIEPNTEGGSFHTVINGTFLLDNVEVTTIPKLKEQPGNLLKNGDFENSTFGWNLRSYQSDPKKLLLPGENISLEQKDLPKDIKSSGAMKVTLQNLLPDEISHRSGASVSMAKMVKKEEEDLKITFYARLLTPDKANLQITRLNGGGNAKPVTLTREWAAYEVVLPLAYDTQTLLFSLVASDQINDKNHPVIEGSFLLDQVVVTAVPKVK